MQNQHYFAIRMAAGALVALLAGGHLVAQSNQPPEDFRAFAVSLGGPRSTAGSAIVEISVDRWSSKAEQKMLLNTLAEKGPEALLDAFQDMRPVGRIRTPDSLGYDLHYAYQAPAEDGGRNIVLATDRPISFWEAANRPRSIDYPFTLVQIHMPEEGKGEGKLSVATRITESGGIISLENYATQPVMLNEVESATR